MNPTAAMQIAEIRAERDAARDEAEQQRTRAEHAEAVLRDVARALGCSLDAVAVATESSTRRIEAMRHQMRHEHARSAHRRDVLCRLLAFGGLYGAYKADRLQEAEAEAVRDVGILAIHAAQAAAGYRATDEQLGRVRRACERALAATAEEDGA